MTGLIPIYTTQYTMERTMSDTTATSTVANRLSLRKIVVASAATFIGLVMTWVVLTAKSEPQAGPPPERPAPLVDVINVSPRTHQLIVYTQGTIDAKRRVELVAQIAGKINDVSPVFADGGFFRKNDVLLSIEPEDYEFALARAQSALAQAEQRLAEERGRSRQAAREWRELGAKDANDLFLRKPQLRAAELGVKAAEADVAAAELALDRTFIRAPFDGRIQQKRVDIGQFVGNGTPLAQIYALDSLELRLPLSDAQLALLPERLLTSAGGLVGSTSTLSVNIGGRSFEFTAPITRSEAELDRRSRVATVIAEFSGSPDLKEGRPALTPGMFATAEIIGRPVDNVIELSNAALSPDGHVLVVNDESKLERRDVSVVSREGRSVWVSGLREGDMVVAELNNALLPGLRVTTETAVN